MTDEFTLDDCDGLPPVRVKYGTEIRTTRSRSTFRGFIPLDSLTIIFGREGEGKSLWAGEFIARATTGRLDGDMRGVKAKALIVGNEDGLESTWKPRLDAAGADPTMYAFDPIDMDDYPVHLGTARGRAMIADLMHAEGMTILYADHLSALLPDDVSTNDYQEAGKAVRAINRWAIEERITVIGTWHMTKGGGSGKDKLVGSVAFRASARAAVAFAKHPETGVIWMALSKANNGDTDRPAMGFPIIPVDYVTDDGEMATTIRCGDVGDMAHDGSGRDMVDAIINMGFVKPEDDEGKALPCEAWLERVLRDAGVPLPRSTVMTMGLDAGYGKSTLQRARERVGVVSQPVGRSVMWSLPDVAHDVAMET